MREYFYVVYERVCLCVHSRLLLGFAKQMRMTKFPMWWTGGRTKNKRWKNEKCFFLFSRPVPVCRSAIQTSNKAGSDQKKLSAVGLVGWMDESAFSSALALLLNLWRHLTRHRAEHDNLKTHSHNFNYYLLYAIGVWRNNGKSEGHGIWFRRIGNVFDNWIALTRFVI